MSSKHNPNPSPLAALTETQQQELLSWIDSGQPLHEIVERVRRDPPEGFGLVTYPTSLRRFYARHALASKQDDLALAVELPRQPTAQQRRARQQALAPHIRSDHNNPSGTFVPTPKIHATH